MASNLLETSSPIKAGPLRAAASALSSGPPRLTPAWPRVLLLTIGLALYAVVLLRCAWITEDTYIMFRTTDNVLHGYGATWNIGERVQVYTCPLWFGLLLPFHALTGEYYFTALAVSAVVSLLAVGLVCFRIAATTGGVIVAAAIFTASKGFIDYSTSGLENPLTHLLLAMFCWTYFRSCDQPVPRGLWTLSLLASLGMVNRLDTVLLYGPALLGYWWQVPKRAGTSAVLLGMLPLIGWEIFSIIYYGFPFPNTAYAKLNLGRPATELMLQGLTYCANALHSDALAPVCIVVALGASVLGRRWRELALAVGVLLYVGYIVKIGGDYMSMRFLTAPLMVAVILLVRTAWWRDLRVALVVSVAVLGVGSLHPRSPLRSGSRYGTATIAGEVASGGIADERGFYHNRLGLLAARSAYTAGFECFPGLTERKRARNRDGPKDVIVRGTIGISVFQLPAQVHVIDPCALATPLLAHLPVSGPGRPGHHGRHLPPGYLDSVITGANRFEDRNLGAYYEKLQLIVAGDLWDAQRWRAIWEMNTGQLSHLIDRDYYRQPPDRRGPPPAASPQP